MLKALATSLVLFFSFSAHAIFIEPYLGYNTGKANSTPVGGGASSSADTSHVGMGLRLGYKFMLPWVALDYSTGSGKAKGSSSENDYTQTNLGAVVGVDLPVGFRVFAGYGFQNEYKIKGTNGANDLSFKGSYTKAGLGFKLIPLVALNLEYIMNKYSKADAGTGEIDISQLWKDHDHNTVMISLSVPFNL